MKYSFYTLVYGDEYYFDLLENISIPSILQPNNIPRITSELGDIVFCFYTMPDQRPRVRALVQASGLANFGHVRVIAVHPPGSGQAAPRLLAISALIHQIGLCLKQDRRMIFSHADKIFGDGSLYRLAKLAMATDKCLLSPYVRVLDTAFRENLARERWPIDNAGMVELALASMHPALLESRRELETNASYHGGLSLQDLGGGNYAMTSRLPNVDLARFAESDLAFFKGFSDFRSWDWMWPAKLVAENRFYEIGSSDAFIAPQITPAHKAAWRVNSADRNGYVGYHLHNLVGRDLVYQLRSRNPVDLDEVARRIVGVPPRPG